MSCRVCMGNWLLSWNPENAPWKPPRIGTSCRNGLSRIYGSGYGAAFGKLLQPQALQLEIREDAPGTSYGIRTAPIPGPRLAETGRFILAAKADMAPERLAMELPEKIKVGSSANITDLVRRNLRGIPVIPARTHPEEIPYHAGFTYFGLDPNHEFWRQIQETSALAFHISGDLPGLELEMWVINHEKD
uniref:Type VI secretion, VC_A0110, EvfL, ImpJ, VasE n=1 Tax=Candidatus Kentrum sp. DK TaxID=2126562 RepID=A0A450TDS9_9GAMM|nr:MAG: Type VI secretion, VC_A0110, EvfL, ImpJ, VasE [Candidatus Kentron sp. DK]